MSVKRIVKRMGYSLYIVFCVDWTLCVVAVADQAGDEDGQGGEAGYEDE